MSSRTKITEIMSLLDEEKDNISNGNYLKMSNLLKDLYCNRVDEPIQAISMADAGIINNNELESIGRVDQRSIDRLNERMRVHELTSQNRNNFTDVLNTTYILNFDRRMIIEESLNNQHYFPFKFTFLRPIPLFIQENLEWRRRGAWTNEFRRRVETQNEEMRIALYSAINLINETAGIIIQNIVIQKYLLETFGNSNILTIYVKNHGVIHQIIIKWKTRLVF